MNDARLGSWIIDAISDMSRMEFDIWASMPVVACRNPDARLVRERTTIRSGYPMQVLPGRAPQ